MTHDQIADPLRLALRSAIAARQTAAETAAKAAAAAERAQGLVEKYQTSIDDLGDVDSAISAYRVSRLKIAAANGDLPESLITRRARRAELLEGLRQAQSAAAALEKELSRATEKLTTASRLVEAAAKAILEQRSVRLTADLATCWSTLWDVADEIFAIGMGVSTSLGCSKCHVDEGSRYLLAQLATLDHRHTSAIRQHGENLQTWFSNLLRDPDAEL
jgi:hypothetical protein